MHGLMHQRFIYVKYSYDVFSFKVIRKKYTYLQTRLDTKVPKNEMRMSSVQHATTLIKMHNVFRIFTHIHGELKVNAQPMI